MSPESRKQISADGTYRGLSPGSRRTQFRPGVSGNPGGRSRKHREIYERCLSLPVKIYDIDENGFRTERVVTLQEAMVRNLFDLATTPTAAGVRAAMAIHKIVDGD